MDDIGRNRQHRKMFNKIPEVEMISTDNPEINSKNSLANSSDYTYLSSLANSVSCDPNMKDIGECKRPLRKRNISDHNHPPIEKGRPNFQQLII